MLLDKNTSIGISTLFAHYCKTLFIREDFIFALIRESTEMRK